MKTILCLLALSVLTACAATRVYSPADSRSHKKAVWVPRTPPMPPAPTAPVITQERVTAEFLLFQTRAAEAQFIPSAAGDPGVMHCPCSFITLLGQRLFRAAAHQAPNQNLVVEFSRTGPNGEREPALFVSCSPDANEWSVTGPGDVPDGYLIGRNTPCDGGAGALPAALAANPRKLGVTVDFPDGRWTEVIGGGIVARPGWRLWKKVL